MSGPDGGWPRRWLDGAPGPDPDGLRALADDAPDAQARLRVWRSLEAPARRPTRWPAALLGISAAAVALCWVAVAVHRTEPVEPTFCVVSDAAGELQVGAPDRLAAAGVGARLTPGSRAMTGARSEAVLEFDHLTQVALDSRTDVRVQRLPGGDEVALRGGKLQAHVSHQPAGKSFSVTAGQWRVRVVGTRFSVASDAAVAVEVTEGTVSVESRDDSADIVRVHAGECWNSTSRTVARCVAPPVEAPPPTPSTPPVAPPRLTASAKAPPRLVVPEPPPAVLSRPPLPQPEREEAAAIPLPAPQDEAEQYDQGVRLSRTGRYADAVAIFAQVANARRSRAAPALYQVGWLKQEHLSDPGGALLALEQYRRDYPGGGLRQEVDLTLIEALLSQGADARAAEEIAGFLSAYPRNERRAELLLVRGDLLRRKGDCAGALASYAGVDSAAPSPTTADDALYASAYCQSRLGHAAEAQALLREYGERFPEGRHHAEVERALGE